ncbi:uncharacterized protein LOC8271907 isoform X2 [Ricinus communis]|uniref:uncharacterized protein LOC8271907 isoform X2 n=1 Tax=Ricinus communis TaxID=3988 RepID=UPI0007729718|nr:uncharacterized protein LOC8271907 isoform X2 [Ricinus communis]|eukprot:XP_015577676.1 uncharacterized protein LOC8271907 isoform X2 [Ricinus communis]
MLSSGNNNLSRGSAAISSDLPPLTQCLPLEQITLGNQKYTRCGELRRALGVPLGSASEDYSFGVSHPKPQSLAGTEELKHFKESVQDTSRKARDRAKMWRDSLFKLDKYREALSSKKRQRSELPLNERSNGATLAKMGSQVHRNSHDIMAQRLEDRAKNIGLNKRVRTSVADVRADGRSNLASRQQMVMEKGTDMLQDSGGGTVRFEEKIRRLPAGGEGWDTKNKKKRSIGVVGSRILNGDREIKRAMHPKISAESKLRSCDTQGFRSKSSPGVSGISKLDGPLEPTGSDTSTVLRNEMDTVTLPRDRLALLEQKAVTKGSNKPNVNEDNLASSPNTMMKAKARAPRTSSIMMLDSSLKVQSSSTSLQGSSSVAQWVGQRPKNSRTRRTNIVAPVSNHVDAQISSQGFATNDFSTRTSTGTNGSLIANSIDNHTPKFKREIDIGLSESEESGAGDNKTKEKGINSGEVALTSSQRAGHFLLPSKKNKLLTNEIGDGVRRQGRSGRGSSLTRPGIHVVREKLENLPTIKPLQSVNAVSDKNKSKTGRPPSKKLKDRKSSARVGPIINSGSLDYTGESDDDREELFSAANSARNASIDRASCGPFWKKMESIFASVSSEDLSFLKEQLSFADELDEGLSQMLGSECNLLGVLVQKELPDYCGERQGDHSNQDSVKKSALYGKVDMGRLEKGAPLYQRVLSALIEEDESEEFYIHSEGKNIPLHYASDDSHCGSCNLIDIESKDRDRMESEVESTVDFQTHRNSFLDRISCDKSVASNTFRNSSMSNSLHSNGQWPGDDDFSHSDIVHASEICSNDLSQLQTRDLTISAFPSSDHKYQLMYLDDRVLLELQSIGLCPETLPDLAEGEEMIGQDIMELKEGLYQQIGRKKRKLGRIDKAVQKGKEVERRTIEQIAMDQLVELAHRKRLACRRNNSSKSAVRKVSRQVALAFIKRTLARCRKFEDTGSSCFSEPALQEVIFSTPTCNNDAKSVDCVGSGTASNTCNEVSNHHGEARGSVAISSTFEIDDSHGDYFDRGRKREVLIDDVIGSASSRVTSSLDSAVLGGVKGKRSDRERDINKDIIRCNSVSGTSHSSLDGLKNDRKTKSKPKQKNNHLSTSGNGPRGSSHSVAGPSNKLDSAGSMSLGDASKEAEEPIDYANLQLHELDTIGLEVSNELGGPQDLGSWLNFDDDALQDHDSMGLAIPMDDLTDLQMLM